MSDALVWAALKKCALEDEKEGDKSKRGGERQEKENNRKKKITRTKDIR